MASNTSYHPVGIEEDFRHNSNSSRHRDQNYRNDNYDDVYAGSYLQNPHRNPNGGDQDYIDGMLPTVKQVRSMIGVCWFALIVLGIGVIFLLGVCLGFYVRESQQDNLDLDELCGMPEKPGIDYDKLGGYHETLMYYIRGEEIRKFVDEFGREDPMTGSDLEHRLETAVLEQFNTHRLDSIQVEEHSVLVTYPDPSQPNRLEVVHANGTITHFFELLWNTDDAAAGGGGGGGVGSGSTNPVGRDATGGGGGIRRKRSGILVTDDDDGGDGDGDNNASSGNGSGVFRNNSTDDIERQKYLDRWWRFPHVGFSPAGVTEAPLVFGHYGLGSDLQVLELMGVSLAGKTLLVRLGRASVADKILEAERRGVVSVLLYWELADHRAEKGSSINPHSVPYASAATYIEDSPSLWRPSIPVQTISTHQALRLLDLLGEEGDAGRNSTNTKDSFLVKLRVNNKSRMQKIRNIIATVQGTEEIDHYTIVGAPRASPPHQPAQDTVVSTSILTQLVKAFQYVHQLHLWKPRRGVKVISWGGAEFSNAGMLMHLLNRHHVLDRRAMAYIDVSHLVSGNSSIGVQATGSLQQLLKEVAFDITDPRDDEQTIQSRFLQHQHQQQHQQSKPKGDKPASLYSPLSGFGTDNTLSPFLHMLGVPTIGVQFTGPSDDLTAADITSLQAYNHQHHYKFHIAATRLLVMSLLTLLDNLLLPMNTQRMARDLESTLWQTSSVLEGCTDDRASLEYVLSKCGKFERTAKALEELGRDYVRRNNTRGIHMVNGVKMALERVFVTRQQHGSSHHILYPSNPNDGSLQHATHLCQLTAVSRSLKPIFDFGDLLEKIVREADLMLRIGA